MELSMNGGKNASQALRVPARRGEISVFPVGQAAYLKGLAFFHRRIPVDLDSNRAS